jgi:Tol biopolymer transport system component
MSTPPYEEFVPRRRFLSTVAVSPDGHNVAYSADDAGQFHLWTTSLDGGTPTQRTTDDAQSVRAIAWSPEGTRLAFAADRDGDEQHQIYVLDLDTGEVTRVSRTRGRQHVLAGGPFDPTGRFLAFAGNDRDEAVQDVLIADLDAGDVRRIESQEGCWRSRSRSRRTGATCSSVLCAATPMVTPPWWTSPTTSRSCVY